MGKHQEHGILYFAKGEEFIEEAKISAQQANSVMPDCQITVVTDQDVTADCFDTVLGDESPFLKRDKARAMQRTPYDKTLYMDTDTYIDQPAWELFDLLDEFDLAVRKNRDCYHIPTGGSEVVAGVPPGVPEFNTGIIPYRDTPAVMEMLADWEERCLQDHDSDQRTFRPALYHSDVRFCTLQNRYNCMYRNDNVVNGEVKIFHGPLVDRDRDHISTVVARQKLNQNTGFRIHRTFSGELFVNPPLPALARLIAICRDEGLIGAARSVCSLITRTGKLKSEGYIKDTNRLLVTAVAETIALTASAVRQALTGK